MVGIRENIPTMNKANKNADAKSWRDYFNFDRRWLVYNATKARNLKRMIRRMERRASKALLAQER